MTKIQVPPRCIGRCPFEGKSKENYPYLLAMSRKCDGPVFETIRTVDEEPIVAPLPERIDHESLPETINSHTESIISCIGNRAICGNKGLSLGVDEFLNRLDITE